MRSAGPPMQVQASSQRAETSHERSAGKNRSGSDPYWARMCPVRQVRASVGPASTRTQCEPDDQRIWLPGHAVDVATWRSATSVISAHRFPASASGTITTQSDAGRVVAAGAHCARPAVTIDDAAPSSTHRP